MDTTARARIAIYDDLLSSPRVVEVGPAPVMDFIESIASTTYTEARALGGSLPYTVIREIAENFIHASFRECTVSLLDQGNTISFSDQGPGIEKKHLVQQPGVSSATAEMKHFIKGVGSGFPIVKEYLNFSQGHLSITDNAIEGTVVTLSIHPNKRQDGAQTRPLDSLRAETTDSSFVVSPSSLYKERGGLGQNALSDELSVSKSALAPIFSADTLNEREKQALLLAAELGAVGPSDLIKRLDISMPTISRLLKELENRGLLEPVAHRKRILSNTGLHCLKEAGLWS